LEHIKQSNPCTGLDRPWGFLEAQAPRYPLNWHTKVVRLSVLQTGCLYSQGIFLELISVIGWVDPRATVQPEGLSQWKLATTPSGIRPMSFWPVAQCREPYLSNNVHNKLPTDAAHHPRRSNTSATLQ
jgi:hypothetical protein